MSAKRWVVESRMSNTARFRHDAGPFADKARAVTSAAELHQENPYLYVRVRRTDQENGCDGWLSQDIWDEVLGQKA